MKHTFKDVLFSIDFKYWYLRTVAYKGTVKIDVPQRLTTVCGAGVWGFIDSFVNK